ncbi:MAG: hypothetical protein R2911_03160 [Caldilineaceae bacterium]
MILAQGITAFFGRSYVDRQITGLNPLHIPVLSDIPAVGAILFSHDILTYLSVPLAVGLWLFFNRTKWGLVLRATGERDEVAFASGYSPTRVRYLAVMAGGFLAGLGGAQLSVAYTLNWVENMTQGKRAGGGGAGHLLRAGHRCAPFWAAIFLAGPLRCNWRCRRAASPFRLSFYPRFLFADVGRAALCGPAPPICHAGRAAGGL